MKKRISLMIIFALLLGILAGCGGDPAQEAPAPEKKGEAKEAAAQETKATADPHLGSWISVYMDLDGLKLLMGEEEGLAADLEFREGGKAILKWYDTEDGHQEAEGAWKTEGDTLTLTFEDPLAEGTFTGIFEGDKLTMQEFPGEGFVLAYGREGSDMVETLKAEVPDFLDLDDGEGIPTIVPGDVIHEDDRCKVVFSDFEIHNLTKNLIMFVEYTNKDTVAHEAGYRYTALDRLQGSITVQNYEIAPGTTQTVEYRFPNPFQERQERLPPTEVFAEFDSREAGTHGEDEGIIYTQEFWFYPMGPDAIEPYIREPLDTDTPVLQDENGIARVRKVDEVFDSVWVYFYVENFTGSTVRFYTKDGKLNGTELAATMTYEIRGHNGGYCEMMFPPKVLIDQGITLDQVEEISFTLCMKDMETDTVLAEVPVTLNP